MVELQDVPEAPERSPRKGWWRVNVGRDAFKIDVCEALFGCHVMPSTDEDMNRIFRCTCCEKPIDIRAWAHAEHEADCIINDVRDYLSMHKPECVRSFGKDWVRRVDSQAKP